MTLLTTQDTASGHPLELVERIVAANEWPFERNGDEEISFAIGGSFSRYHLWFGWHRDTGALHLRCAFDLTTQARRFGELCELLARINDRLWLGHFDAGSHDQAIAFRHTVLVGDGPQVSLSQLESLVEIAIATCERFYPAFMLLIWGGKGPADAVDAAMLETVGEA